LVLFYGNKVRLELWSLDVTNKKGQTIISRPITVRTMIIPSPKVIAGELVGVTVLLFIPSVVQ
jgi:hypothetical protein